MNMLSNIINYRYNEIFSRISQKSHKISRELFYIKTPVSIRFHSAVISASGSVPSLRNNFYQSKGL